MEFAVILWALFCVAVAILANRYNRNPIGWFILSLLLSPLIGFVFVLAAGPASVPRSSVMDKVANPKGGLLKYLPPARAHRW